MRWNREIEARAVGSKTLIPASTCHVDHSIHSNRDHHGLGFGTGFIVVVCEVRYITDSIPLLVSKGLQAAGEQEHHRKSGLTYHGKVAFLYSITPLSRRRPPRPRTCVLDVFDTHETFSGAPTGFQRCTIDACYLGHPTPDPYSHCVVKEP